jgi:hypothetical protein
MGLQISKHSARSQPPAARKRTSLFPQRPEEAQGALFLKVSRLGDDGTEKSGNMRNCAFVVQEDLNVDRFTVYSLHRPSGRLTFFSKRNQTNPKIDTNVVTMEMVTRLRGDDLREVDDILRELEPGPRSEAWARWALNKMWQRSLMVNDEAMAAHALLQRAVR